MDINKILFEQLNINNVQNPFFAQDVDALENVQKESVQEENTEIKEEISSALNTKDEDSNLVFEDKSSLSLNKTQKNLSNTQILMNVLSNESQALEEDAQEIEEEIQKKNEEYEQLAQEIAEKQEEYNSLVSKAESSNDESVIASANELGEEINSLVGKLDSIKTEITNLESDLSAKETSANNFNTTINNLSKVQSTLSQEVAQTNAVTAADTVQEVSEVSEISEVTEAQETQTPQSTRQHVEIKTMEEYKEILDCKFNELWEKYGNADSVIQYVKNNFVEYLDATGDGRVDKIDMQIFENYLNLKPSLGSNNPVVQEKGRDYASGLVKFAQELKKNAYYATSSISVDTYLYDLTDVENYAKLGGKPSMLRNNLDITAISQEENWRERLLVAGYPESELRTTGNITGNIYDKVSSAEKFIKCNPDNAQYAAIAAKFQSYQENINKDYSSSAERELEHRNNMYKEYLSDSAYYNEFKSSFAGKDYSGTQADYAYDYAYSASGGRNAHDSTESIISDKLEKIKTTAYGYKPLIDINGDGVCNAKDVDLFDTNIDLDGDGVVSSEEKCYLNAMKNNMQDNVYSSAAKKGYLNLNSIDDVISTLEVCDETYIQGLKDKAVAANTAMYESDAGEDYSNASGTITVDGVTYKTNWGSCHTSRYAWQLINKYTPTGMGFLGNYMDGTTGIFPDGYDKHALANIDDLDYTNQRLINAIDYTNPKNTYLHYINSADLSKEELQCILQKINSASEKVQSQLAEVKALVEQKLAAMQNT